MLAVGHLIEVDELRKEFTSGLLRSQRVTAVDDVSLCIHRGETLGLIGESGCGKTTLARLLARLLPATSGQIQLGDADLLAAGGETLRQLRRQVQIVFQDAEGTLDPRMRVRDLLLEPLRVYGLLEAAAEEALNGLLGSVNLTRDLLDRFPHQLSGGQRQRIGIARALSLDPEFVVLDEPAASLDLSMQAQVLDSLRRHQQQRGTSYLLITHNLKVLQLMATQVVVMYLGRIVESGPTEEVFADPRHPYTRALIDSMPQRRVAGEARPPITGEPPSPIDPPPGCHFHPRCPLAEPLCSATAPTLVGGQRRVACHMAEAPP